uniref:Uncharacterized protein n=1 Tax=Rhizophora mucronata TaxID=61149 RepID=A0A2P2KQE7_RHIMU
MVFPHSGLLRTGFKVIKILTMFFFY